MLLSHHINRRLLIGLLLLFLVSLLGGCSSPPADNEEAPPRQVRRELARLLSESEHLRLTEFREEGPGHYAGVAESPGGAKYQVTATTAGRALTYEADGGGRLLRGRANLPEPPFDERHPEAMQWLRAAAIIVQGAGVVWPALGAFGLRRRYSRRMETILALAAAVNAGFVVWWIYQIVIEMRGS
jgi:hypothetical protein